MEWGDWQFWLVTLAAVWGIWSVIRQLLPAKSKEEPPCAHCSLAAGVREAADKKRQQAPRKG